MKKKQTNKTNKNQHHILRMAEGFEKMQPNGGRVGHLPLESNIRNWSRIHVVYLKTKVDMLFFTIKNCQNFTLTKGHGAEVMVGKCMRMESFSFSCAMLDHLSLPWLVLAGLHYEGTMVNQTFLVQKFDHFFLSLEAFHALSLHDRELVFILLLPCIQYCIKWY